VRKGKSTKSESPEFSNFKRLVKNLIAVPKKEVEIEEARWRANRLKKKKPAT
jgi:hypothetical protein